MAEAVLGVKLKDCENVVEYTAIIYGAGAEDDGGLDMTAFSASKLFFPEGVFDFVVLGEFFGPDDLHYKEEISLNFPDISGFVNKWLIGNLFNMYLMNSFPEAEVVL